MSPVFLRAGKSNASSSVLSHFPFHLPSSTVGIRRTREETRGFYEVDQVLGRMDSVKVYFVCDVTAPPPSPYPRGCSRCFHATTSIPPHALSVPPLPSPFSFSSQNRSVLLLLPRSASPPFPFAYPGSKDGQLSYYR